MRYRFLQLVKQPKPPERRRKLRLECSYAATVRGKDARGRAFEYSAVLDNLSACGLALRLRRKVAKGEQIFVVVHFPPASFAKSAAQGIAMHGVVQRLEPHLDGSYGLGIEFHHYRFV